MTNKWTYKLPGAVYERLCNCRNVREDIPVMIDAKWDHMVERGLDSKGYTKEDALVAVLELLDANGQYCDMTPEEYDRWKA